MASKIYPLICDSGIQKDGTSAASKKWTDGEWVRFQRGVPKKMGGWRRLQPKSGYITSVYGIDGYSIGQNGATLFETWNPYHEYQPREVLLKRYNKVYYLFTGCTGNYKYDHVKYTSSVLEPTTIWYSGNSTNAWQMPLPINYTRNSSKIADASSAVTLTILDEDGNIIPATNSFYTIGTTTNFTSQNLTGIGPYAAYYTENTRWVFEIAYSEIVYPYRLSLTSIAKISQPSLALFAIPLYDLDSINTVYTFDSFGSTPTRYDSVYPIVYVTSIEGYFASSDLDQWVGNIQLLYQLSISGNTNGAGRAREGSASNYGPGYVLPTDTTDGHSGTGQQFFPYSNQLGIWSRDSVFCSGGVLSLESFVFFYNFHPWDWSEGNPSSTNGYIAFTYPNMEVYTTDATPTKTTTPVQQTSGNDLIPDEGATTIIQDFVQVDDTKIVFGAKIRGGTESPSALFWSLNKLIKCYYVGSSSVIFQFDIIAGNLSILSSRCVVEVNGIFYWIGNNCFYLYNGVVDTLPNDTNINYFFQNVDRSKAQKIWGNKNEKYNEVIWHYPDKRLEDYNGECNAVLIFNYTQGAECWYNSAFPVANSSSSVTTAGRVCGTHTSDFSYPIWIDAWSAADYIPNSTSPASYWFTWLHENTNDMTVPGLIAHDIPNNLQFQTDPISYPISSSISSREITLAGIGPNNNWNGVDRWLRLTRIEPDFVRTGDITLSFLTRKFSQDYQTQYSSTLVLGDDLGGVCYIQSLLYDIYTTGSPPTSFNLNINGSYATNGVATFPYPRVITVTNYSYFYVTSSSSTISFSMYITITGTYKSKTQTETIKTTTNLIIGASETSTSTLIYDTITSVVLTYDTSAATMDSNCCFVLGVGTKIPKGDEKGNDEFKRLCNFYTDVNVHARRIVLKFTQSGLGGNFELGQFLMHFDVGDGHQ